MIETIYIEKQLKGHERAERIIKKYGSARVVECEHYGEVFNRKGQNFRIQKQAPALILAKKDGRRIYPAPIDHAIGADHNYYFSHLLNCPFDCRYCFLQGKFSSANYVLFVNYEDFWNDMQTEIAAHTEPVHIFSGYDCDSLAFEPITGFVEWLLEALTSCAQDRLEDPSDNMPPSSHLVELRTKSAQIRQILKFAPIKNCLIAYSIAPQSVIDNFEHGTASLDERLTALARLQKLGWQIGLRIDPLISFHRSAEIYQAFFETIAKSLDLHNLHSVTLGTMRFPDSYLKKIKQLYPNEALLASVSRHADGSASYSAEVTQELIGNAQAFFAKHLETNQIFVQKSDQ